MMHVTGDQVREAALKAGITRIDHHDCSMCGEMVFYFIEAGDLYFNSGCGCSWSPPRPRSWSDAADWINMQNGEWREKLLRSFGFDSLPKKDDDNG